MANIFTTISESLSPGGSDLIGQLTGDLNLEVGNLTALGQTLGQLMSDPEALTDLVRSIDEMDLPGFGPDSGFTSVLSSLQQAVPGELGDVLGPMLEGLDSLENTVVGQIADVMTQSMQAAVAIYNLTQLRFGASAVDGPRAETSAAGTSGETPDGGDGAEPAPDSGGAGDSGGSGDAGGDGGAGDGADAAGTDTGPSTDIQSSAAALDSIDQLLDSIPAQAGVKTILIGVADIGSKRSQFPIKIPIVDEIGDMVQTLLDWESLDAGGVQSRVEATIGDLTAMVQSIPQRAFSPLESELSDVRSALHLSDLQNISNVLQTELAVIAQAIADGDLSGTDSAVSALNAACDLQAAVAADWTGGVRSQLTVWLQRLEGVPGDLEDQISHRLQSLQPITALDNLPAITFPQGWTDSQAAVDAFSATLDRYVAWLWDLIDRIDLQTVLAPLATVADGARAAVDGLDDAMVAVTMQVQSLFGEVNDVVDQVDIEAVTETIVTQIDEFGDSLVSRLQDLTAPIREAVEELITTIQGALTDFNPATIAGACEDVMTALGDALGGESLQGAAETIRNAIQSAAERIDQLSFAPVVDQVIGLIEEVTEALESIDPSDLDPILSAALDAAVAILPRDIAALTDPLIDELGRLIEEEAPLPQLALVLDKPRQILDYVYQYEPQQLLGNALTTPFETLLAQLEAFTPGTMLRDPVNQVLETLKDRLRQHANPALLLDPLIPMFEDIIGKIDALNPTQLITPLEERLQLLVDNLLDALHIDEIMDQFNAVIEKIQEILGMGDHARNILQRFADMLEGLLDPQSQFDAWLNPIYDKLTLPDGDGPVAAAQAALAAAVDDVAATALQARFDGVYTPEMEALEAVGADQLLVPAVQAFRAVSRDALDALPGFEAEKAAIIAVLDRCNPIDSAFAAPFQGLADFVRGLRHTRDALAAELTGWDTVWQGADSALTELRNLPLSGDGLRNQLAETVQERLIKPFSGVFNMVKPLRDGLLPMIGSLERMVALLQTRIEDAVLGEDGLGGIQEALNGLVDRIDNFDLSFLTDSLQALFDNVKEKLNALSPAVIRDAVDTEFNQLLEAIDLNLILPAEDPDPLNELFDELVADFALLHPDELVVKPLQEIFDRDVKPLIDAFDLTPVIEELLDRLASMDDELKEEMQRVNTSYIAMLQAVP